MKRQLSLGGKLSIGIVSLLLPVALIIAAIFIFFDRKQEQKMITGVKDLALANAENIAGIIGFNLFGMEQVDVNNPEEEKGQEGDKKIIANILKKYTANKPDVKAVIAYDLKKRVFSKVIKEGFEELSIDLNKVPLKKDTVIIKSNYVLITREVMAESNNTGYLLYVTSLVEYQNSRKAAGLILGSSFLIGISLIAFLVIWWGKRVALPLNRLAAAAQRISDGYLDKIEIDTSKEVREIANLSASVTDMAAALSSQVISTNRLTAQASAISSEISQAMAHLASSASQQAAAVTETASTVEEMERAGKNASQNATQIVESAEKTTETSIRGRQAVETASEIILKIKDDSQEISSKSKHLLGNVEEIGNIINSVNAISEQSKILAVNASIEAAKAGEYGAGFAVVAQEVKDLAQQSKSATEQITKTLTGIRKAIEEMVNTATSGESRTFTGVKSVSNAGAIVNDLSEAIRENSDIANVINASVVQQTHGLTQIASAVEEINISATENQEISLKIEDSTKKMTEALFRLGELVGKWKVADNVLEPEKTESKATPTAKQKTENKDNKDNSKAEEEKDEHADGEGSASDEAHK